MPRKRAELNAIQLAEAVKAKVLELCDYQLSPDHMLVLGPKPVRQGNPPQMMSLASHGWGEWQSYYDPDTPETWEQDACYAELVCDEAHDYLERAATEVCPKGSWDMLKSAVLCFYGEGAW